MVHIRIWAGVCLVFALTAHPGVSLGVGLDAQRLITCKAVELLPDAIAPLFRLHIDELQERAVEPDTAWLRDKTLRDRLTWHRTAMDIEADEQTLQARMSAARGFPYDRAAAKRLYGRMGKRASGELIWVIEDYFTQLTEAFRDGQESDVIRTAGYLMHFAADTSSPFNASANHEGKLTGNLHLGRVTLGHPHYAHRTVAARFAGELVRRNRSRYDDSITMSSGDYDPVNEPAGRARAALLVSLSVLDQVTAADAELIRLMNVGTGEELLARADEYYQLLDERCGALCVERLRDGAVFAGNLVAGAWIAGGQPSIDQIRARTTAQPQEVPEPTVSQAAPGPWWTEVPSPGRPIRSAQNKMEDAAVALGIFHLVMFRS